MPKRTTTGRRLPDGSDIRALEKAGDYFLSLTDNHGELVPTVYFLLPIHEGEDVFDRATRGSGLHQVMSPPWTFRECDDCSLEIRASIACSTSRTRPDFNAATVRLSSSL